eukprot:TRINITY_DN1151_c0_g1_i1.p1 TRINITY_DN1151_c0_g1~~TRINITY_DN1151_c0_g1_i1.p1  ORF type:complete len:448 (+),score=127.11 TRINITY_DN1151_c0_g1_i1:91-1434(+)
MALLQATSGDQPKENLESRFANILGDPSDSTARFVKQKRIGKGSHGEAFLVTDREDPTPPAGTKPRRYVAKVMELPQMSQRDLRYAYSEIRCMSLLDHANIVRYVADFQSKESLLIVMEYADGGDLERQVKTRAARDCEYFKEHEVLFIFLQLALALDHVHGRKMLHRDLKTANVFLTAAGVVKLGDFGYSHEYQETVSNVVAGTFCGTPVYLAPELWKSKRYSKKADIWSLGVILYEMLALKRPYFSPHMKELMEKILREDYAPPPPHYSDQAISLCHTILDKEPTTRPNIRQITAIEYVQKGLKQLIDIVVRNTLIDERVKKCLRDHVDEVMVAVQRPVAAASPISRQGEVYRATGTISLEWEKCWLVLDSSSLRLYKQQGDTTPIDEFKADEITNACPVSPQEAEKADVWAVFLNRRPHTVWWRCTSQQECDAWLDDLLAIISI